MDDRRLNLDTEKTIRLRLLLIKLEVTLHLMTAMLVLSQVVMKTEG
jgi:hypothetical protein